MATFKDLRVGDWVRTNGDDNKTTEYFEGEVGEIGGNHIYIWQNEKLGTSGKLPHKGYKYSWAISLDNTEASVEVIKKTKTEKDTKKITMKTLKGLMSRLLDGDTQKLYKAGYIDGDLQLTADGKEELMMLLFIANKTELVKLAEAKIAEEEKK